jgi:NAD(P)-dependent dehydrogenase (short-subunit alcohol dehydrogenase family)
MSHDLYGLEGKLVLVTGAGTGIGQGIAVEMAQRGADVVLQYYHSEQGAMEAVSRVTAIGRRATAIQADLGQVADCIRCVDEAATFLGGLDGLVNNAGVTASLDFLEVTEEQFNHLYFVNIRGQFFCAQQAVRHIIKRGEEWRCRSPEMAWPGGSIVNISSVHAFAGLAGSSIYSGTKGAINAFSRQLAIELCPTRIRVNVLAPGVIEVPRYWEIYEHYSSEMSDRLVPWGRRGLPEDVAHAAAFLMSDAAEFITGQVVYIDGGQTAKIAQASQLG